MQKVSKEYKAAMKRQYRNRSYVRINIGVINQEAQRTAYVDSSVEPYSNLQIFASKIDGTKEYATYEEDYIKLNRTICFLPSNMNAASAKCAISKNMVSESPQEIRILFQTAALDIRGVTLNFGDDYPVDFTITNGNSTVEVIGNKSGEYSCEDVFSNTTYLSILATKMQTDHKRLRLYSVMFGVGIQFDYKKIISTNHIMRADQINEDLPSVDFNFKIENIGRELDIESKSSSINYLETGQNLEVEYGLEMDDGTVEWLKGGVLKVKSWKSDDVQAEFDAVDLLVYLDDEYYKGRYYADGITLYDLAVDVLTDAGVDEGTYSIDNYLRSIKVKNPLPIVQHKAALQIIANAGRCTLFINRLGMVSMKSSFMPEFSISSNGEEAYSQIENIQDEAEKAHYASLELDNLPLNTSHYFLSKDADYLQTGYTSAAISNEDGTFSENPVITVLGETSFTTYGLYLLFANYPPEDFTIAIYKEDVLRDSQEVVGNTEQQFFINYEFSDFDKMVLTFNKTGPHKRVHVDYLKFGETTEYTLDYDAMTKTPTGVQLSKIKELQVIRTNYTKSTEEVSEIASEDVNVSPNNREFTILFDEFGYDFSAECEGYTVSVVESGAHYCVVYFDTYPTIETLLKLTVKGNKMNTSTSHLHKQINLRGEVKVWDNPLISDVDHAQDVLEWLADYYNADKEYQIPFRGDPCLDANDTLWIENKYNDQLKGRIYYHEIHTAGSLSGMIKARREMDVAGA